MIVDMGSGMRLDRGALLNKVSVFPPRGYRFVSGGTPARGGMAALRDAFALSMGGHILMKCINMTYINIAAATPRHTSH